MWAYLIDLFTETGLLVNLAFGIGVLTVFLIALEDDKRSGR